MRIAFVDLHAQHQPLRAALDRAIGEVVASGQFILGPQVAAFEQRFAAYCGVRHAIGVGNGMDALRLALMALDVRGGDEVILPANTYVATALAVSAVGAVPVLVDCDPRTYNLDPRGLERAVTPRTRVIMPVHLTGQAADMDAVMAVAERRGLHVIEDAAQAHGAAWRGRRCGSIGAVGCFSFYPSKNLGAFGDAGMAVTNDDALARRLAQLRNYGQSQKYEHVAAGLNSRRCWPSSYPTWTAATTRASRARPGTGPPCAGSAICGFSRSPPAPRPSTTCSWSKPSTATGCAVIWRTPASTRACTTPCRSISSRRTRPGIGWASFPTPRPSPAGRSRCRCSPNSATTRSTRSPPPSGGFSTQPPRQRRARRTWRPRARGRGEPDRHRTRPFRRGSAGGDPLLRPPPHTGVAGVSGRLPCVTRARRPAPAPSCSGAPPPKSIASGSGSPAHSHASACRSRRWDWRRPGGKN